MKMDKETDVYFMDIQLYQRKDKSYYYKARLIFNNDNYFNKDFLFQGFIELHQHVLDYMDMMKFVDEYSNIFVEVYNDDGFGS